MKKRLLSILLTVILCVGMLPMGALALTPEGYPQTAQELAEMLNKLSPGCAVAEDDTVTLQSDVHVSNDGLALQMGAVNLFGGMTLDGAGLGSTLKK